jgi:hypothetical protein
MQPKHVQTAHYVALAYLAEHDGEHLDGDRALLIERCVSHLVDAHMLSTREAGIVAAQALGELQARKCRAYIDMSLTTSYAVFIRDPHMATMRAFTVAELLDLVTPAPLAG